jgi:hypothetical protein
MSILKIYSLFWLKPKGAKDGSVNLKTNQKNLR